MEDLAQALRSIADVDHDLARTPEGIGAPITAAAELAAGDVHPAGHRWVVQLDPLLLALPLTRTLLLAAAGADLIEVVLPDETPESLRELLVGGASLTLDQATSVVDLTIDALSVHLGVTESLNAGLASSGHALAHADRVLAGASTEHPERLAAAVAVATGVFGAIDSAHALAQALGHLGLAETAALVDVAG